MEKECINRLTVIGSKRQVLLFRKSNWEAALHPRYFELMENSPHRYIGQFYTDSMVLEPLRKLSRRFPRLVFLVEWEAEAERIKGLAKAAAGELGEYRVKY